MAETREGDLSSMLEKSLEERLEKAKNSSHRNPAVVEALITFDKVYKSRRKEKTD